VTKKEAKARLVVTGEKQKYGLASE